MDAVEDIPDGGIIDIAAGTYATPNGGFWLSDLQRGFTIRARAGGTVVFDGGGSHNIVRFENSSKAQGGPVTFEGITFANGYMASFALAGGVSLIRAEATFVNCTFKNNKAEQTGVGGGVLVHQSNAFFFDSTWQDNTSAHYGGGMAISDGARVYVHNASFYRNRVNLPGHSTVASGGGIHVLNATLRVSNTRFEGNQAGAFGGALYALGNWTDPLTTPRSDVIVTNATFVDNQATPDASVSLSSPTEGGAINIEDQTILKVYSSRFVTNRANIGGGVNSYRAKVEIYDSVFQGNQANGVPSIGAFGGSLSVSSLDGAGDGSSNRPTGQVTVEDTLFQGRYANITKVAPTGGCLSVGGDSRRIDGDPAIPDVGSVAENRANLTLRRVVLNDCDAHATESSSGAGGGISAALANVTMENSIVMNSDAFGSGASGGALVLLYHSVGNITNTMFAKNSSGQYGGAVFVQGSTLNLSDSRLVENAISTLYGADIFAAPDDVRKLAASGTVQNNTFSNNAGGFHIFDDDRTGGPFNLVVYKNNQFYQSSGVGADVYKTSYPAACYPNGCTVTELNSLNLKHGSATTDKGSGNTAVESIPSVGKLLAVPPSPYTSAAPGDTVPTAAYLGYAWSGDAATLDGSSLTNRAGVVVSPVGTHTLAVGNASFNASIAQPTLLAATFTAVGSPAATTLSWQLTAGTFVDAVIDRAAPYLSAAAGSVDVSDPTETTYRLLILTQEGGLLKTVTTGSPTLSAPAAVTVLAGLNLPTHKAYIPIQNVGSGTMDWTVVGQTPDLFTVETPAGQTQAFGTVVLALRVSKAGTYTGFVEVDAGAAGRQTVQVNVIVVDELKQVFTPLVNR
ncbi:MAG: hypothetical protein ACOYYS_01875 [Chloroflexota bacterium]